MGFFSALGRSSGLFSRDMGRESDRPSGIGFGTLGHSSRSSDWKYPVCLRRVDRKPMGHSNDGERSALFRNQRFLFCCCPQCDPAHWLDSRDADRLWPGSGCDLQVLRIFKPQPLDHPFRSDHYPVGCCGSPNLEMAATDLCFRAVDFMYRHDLYRLSRIWVGHARPNSQKKRFPFHGRNGSCYRHAHLLASFGFGLFALCHGFEEEFLGDLDRLFYRLFLDVFDRSDGYPCHPIPRSLGVVMNLMLKFGWAIPALIIVLFSTFTTTFLDIYSTASPV